MRSQSMADYMPEYYRRIEVQRVIDQEWESDPDRFFTLPTNPSWDDIAKYEPAINDLIAVAIQGFREDTETYNFWYRVLKPALSALVGKSANQPPPLRTSRVYDVVYHRLMQAYEEGV